MEYHRKVRPDQIPIICSVTPHSWHQTLIPGLPRAHVSCRCGNTDVWNVTWTDWGTEGNFKSYQLLSLHAKLCQFMTPCHINSNAAGSVTPNTPALLPQNFPRLNILNPTFALELLQISTMTSLQGESNFDRPLSSDNERVVFFYFSQKQK